MSIESFSPTRVLDLPHMTEEIIENFSFDVPDELRERLHHRDVVKNIDGLVAKRGPPGHYYQDCQETDDEGSDVENQVTRRPISRHSGASRASLPPYRDQKDTYRDYKQSSRSPKRQSRTRRYSPKGRAPSYNRDYSHNYHGRGGNTHRYMDYEYQSDYEMSPVREVSPARSHHSRRPSPTMHRRNVDRVEKSNIVPFPKSLKFNGKSNWQAFAVKFNSWADCSMATEAEKRNNLCWCLEDKASDYYAMLVERDSTISYSELIRKFEKRYGYQDLEQTAELRFYNAKQNTGECIEDWADRCLHLASQAFKSVLAREFGRIDIE